jgi:transcription antitermination factor NusG
MKPFDHIRVTHGTFAGMEGIVKRVAPPDVELVRALKEHRTQIETLLGARAAKDLATPRVSVSLNIFGWPVPVELGIDEVEVV